MAISKAALNVLNSKADQLINPNLLTVGAMRLLPAPYDSLQVAGVFIKLGHDLALTFCLPTDWALLREIGVAMMYGVTAVYAASWSSILNQREQVKAIVYAVGHCYKHYFNLILTNDHCLMPYELGLLTENTLCASLSC